MKSIVSEKPCGEKSKYPCLVVSEVGNIYKMFSSEEGYLVYEADSRFSSRKINGHVSFGPFHGSVCLEND